MPSLPNRPASTTLSSRRSRGGELDASATLDYGTGGPDENSRPTPNVLAVVWRQRWIVVACVILALAAGIGYLVKATPVYASSSIVYVQASTPKIMSDLMMSSGQRSNGYLFTQCQVIGSTAILTAALEKPGVRDVQALRDASNPVGVLKYMTRAEVDKQGDLINVTASSTVPQDAATVANAVVESYIEYMGNQHKSTAVEVLRILQKEVDKYEQSLTQIQGKMLQLKRDNPELAFASERGATPSSARLAELSEAITQQQLRTLDIRTAMAEAQVVKEDPYKLKRLLDQFNLTKDNAPAVDPQLMSEYRNERMRLDELLAKFGTEHDTVKAAQRQLGRLEAEIADATRGMSGTYLALLDEALKASEARTAELERTAAGARGGAIDLNTKLVEYEQLGQDAQRITRSLDALDARMKDINVAEDAGNMSINVLEVARPSGMPVSPQRNKTLAIAVMAGLMLGVGLALLRDTLDHRLRTVDEIVAALDVPMLGAIPHIPLPSGKGRGGGGGGSGSGSGERGLIVHAMARSAVAEAFRTLRTGVYFGIPEGNPGKTILITSPAPGDGKSTTASNLAIAFAQAGRRVLLIDADCRRPRQHAIHGVQASTGLASVLADGATLTDAVQPTSVEGLALLPAGDVPANPAELLDSVAFGELLEQVSAAYDQVIIDSPPIVPVTDARIIAARVDVVVLVLRAERSTRRLATHAREALASVGAPLIGVTVTDVPRGNRSYGYDYYGAGRYGYASNVKVDVGSSGTSGSSGERNGSSRERVAGELISDAPSSKRGNR